MNRSTKAWKRLPLRERKAIAAHHDAVRQMPCVVTGMRDVTLHHCHSGSMSDAGINRGVGQRPSDWLVIPILLDLHVGPDGIDGNRGVISWEKAYGAQFEHLKTVSRAVGYNVFHAAGYDIDVEGLPA
ncbi:MAG: hypothetical protein Q8L20_10920 [Gammaproteobacteria bacterium]|nr:hypothetical protein [Gammaproteobacteria bacterium]